MQQTAQFAKSKIACLLRHRGGNYYASAKVAGKVIRRSLETADFNTAKNRLPGELEKMRGATRSGKAGALGPAIRAEAYREDASIKQSTRKYYQEIQRSLFKVAATLPENPLEKNISRVGLADLRALMDKYSASYSPTCYNGCLALIRRTYERAVESGHVGANIALSLKRVQPKKRNFDLPSSTGLADIIAEILRQRKSHSKAVAMAVEFLAYTGLRISEAREIRWRDIKKDHLVTRTAKNDDIRQVPLIPAAKDLFSRMKAAGIPVGPDDPVMLVTGPREALRGACKRLGVRHVRVHDLRHIFATRCIESGVDLPTLAAWLGHKDGGVLAMQVYGHLCKKHSTAMADKVKV